MSLRFICIELRKNLLCANVFLQFDHSLTETEFLKINVDADALRLREYSTETRVAVAEHFTIEARTMSNLTVEECNASFRLTISDFKDEPTESSQQQENCKVDLDPLPRVQEGTENTTLHCSNCKCQLAATHKFQRIREFPSGSIDVSEFFCHHGPDFGQVLVPQATDLFYGFQFIVLNMEQLQNTTKEKESHLYCARCLQYLGETLFAGKAAKLWADALKFEVENELCDIFCSSSLSSSCQLLHKIIKESTCATEPMLLQQMHFTKALVQATFSNRKRQYLLLHVLEKQLQVLRNAKPLAHGSHNNNNVLQVQLEDGRCFKLLYHLVDEESAESETEDEGGGESKPSILTTWQQDISIHLLKVSPTLFNALLHELEENSLLLPELYRYTHDDFQLSYIFYKH